MSWSFLHALLLKQKYTLFMLVSYYNFFLRSVQAFLVIIWKKRLRLDVFLRELIWAVKACSLLCYCLIAVISLMTGTMRSSHFCLGSDLMLFMTYCSPELSQIYKLKYVLWIYSHFCHWVLLLWQTSLQFLMWAIAPLSNDSADLWQSLKCYSLEQTIPNVAGWYTVSLGLGFTIHIS